MCLLVIKRNVSKYKFTITHFQHTNNSVILFFIYGTPNEYKQVNYTFSSPI